MGTWDLTGPTSIPPDWGNVIASALRDTCAARSAGEQSPYRRGIPLAFPQVYYKQRSFC
jgi:hypothetical protein